MSELLTLHHFSFSSPQYLLVLLVVPLLFLFTVTVRRRRSRYAVAFTNLNVLGGVVRTRRTRWWRRLPLLVIALALSTSAAALARPSVRVVASNRNATIILLADVSGSMQATDIRPSRLYATVSAMRQLVDKLPRNDKIALVTFSDRVEEIVPPTTNHNAIDRGLAVLSPQGGTALGEGVVAAVRIAVASLAADGIPHTPGKYLPAAIVLESDGAQDRGTVTPFAAAQVAKKAGVRIYGVALGTRNGYITQGTGLLKQSIRVLPSPGTVGMLSSQTGGQSYNAINAGALDTIYRSLGTGIGRRHELREITSWFELASAILLVCGVGAAQARGPALP